MHAHGGEQLGIGASQYVRHCTSGRKSGDIDPRCVRAMVGHHLAREACQQCGLAPAPLLVLGLEPVPALLRVCMLCLFGIEHQYASAARLVIHARAGGEVLRPLGAAVQHEDERARSRFEGTAWRHVQPIGQLPASVRVAAEQPLLVAGGACLRCARRHGEFGSIVDEAGFGIDDPACIPMTGCGWLVVGCGRTLASQRALNQLGGFQQMAGARQACRLAQHVLKKLFHGMVLR